MNMWKYFVAVGIVIFGMIGGYSLVFSGNIIFTPDITLGASIGSFVVSENETLSKNYLIYESNIDISDAHIESLCDTTSQYIGNQGEYYLFELTYLNIGECSSGESVLALGEVKYPLTHYKISLLQDDAYFEYLLDLDSQTLESYLPKLRRDIEKNSLYKNFQGEISMEYLKYLYGQRKYKEAEYKIKIINKILQARNKKYDLPVVGSTLSEAFTKIPNSPRPYRAAYTDGIHHGWDIDGEIREEVVALDDGLIVRVVKDFSNQDFSRIEYNNNQDPHRELKNLDILRGKQVWLKTMKGDVVFYSHLDEVYDNIEEGMRVEKGEVFGRTGVTGVPEEGYDDYHLHFAVMKNPYNPEMAGKYDFGDYMAWDWLTKGMTHAQVVEEQKKIFEY